MKNFKVVEKSITHRETIASKLYLSEVSPTEPITRDEEMELFKLIKQGNRDAIDKLVKANLRFVISVSKKYAYDKNLVDDLISAGNYGLVEAVEKFNPDLGYKFISFAVWYIRKEMINCLSESKMIRIPAQRVTLATKIYNIKSKLQQETDNAFTDSDVVDYIKDNELINYKISEYDVNKLVNIDAYHYSLDKPLTHDDDTHNLYDIIESEDYIPSSNDEVNDYRLILDSLLSVLPVINRRIIKMKWGLDEDYTGEPTNGNIGDYLGMSKHKVSMLYSGSLRLLRNRFANNKEIANLIIPC